MTMLYRSTDGAFIIHDTAHCLAGRKCLAIEPGVIDFPGRCAKDRGHTDRWHEGGTSYIGYPQNPPLPPARWENDDA